MTARSGSYRVISRRKTVRRPHQRLDCTDDQRFDAQDQRFDSQDERLDRPEEAIRTFDRKISRNEEQVEIIREQTKTVDAP